jgi:hypothetical protein
MVIRRLQPRVSQGLRSPAAEGTSEAALARAGLKGLFAKGPVAFRRVDEATSNRLVVDGAVLPRALVRAALEPGQWLRFEKQGDVVSVRVDLRATLHGEARFNELLSTLSGGWQPVH